jgi:hypothetical protein
MNLLDGGEAYGVETTAGRFPPASILVASA